MNYFKENMILVKGDTYQMGVNDVMNKWKNVDLNREKPLHIVTLDDFYISKIVVTQELWTLLMGNNPSWFVKGEKITHYPVEQVSWHETQLFIKKLNEITQKNYRLPSESEWEFAAKGGTKTKNYDYSGSNIIDEVAWYINNSKLQTQAVAQKQPNELGLFDMSGNVWEWCQDWYDQYSFEAQKNPQGPFSGRFKVLRGAGWLGYETDCRTSSRNYDRPKGKRSNTGFRLAHSIF